MSNTCWSINNYVYNYFWVFLAPRHSFVNNQRTFSLTERSDRFFFTMNESKENSEIFVNINVDTFVIATPSFKVCLVSVIQGISHSKIERFLRNHALITNWKNIYREMLPRNCETEGRHAFVYRERVNRQEYREGINERQRIIDGVFSG